MWMVDQIASQFLESWTGAERCIHGKSRPGGCILAEHHPDLL